MSKVELIDKNELWAKRHAVDDYGREPYVVDAEDVFYAEVIKAIPLDKVKQAREEIKSISQEMPYRNQAFSYGISICETSKVLKILDKLIGSEGSK